MGSENQDELLSFFKALADANRLRIIGLLAQQGYTVEQLAALLHIKPPTVSHHLKLLAEAGFVSARAESYYNLYQLEPGSLDRLAAKILARDTFIAAASQVDQGAYDRKVVTDYLLPNGRLKTIPAQRKKLEAVLSHIVQIFKSGERYTEKQVNELLGQYHADTATLRRELIGFKMMVRESGIYWKTIQDKKPKDDLHIN